MKRLMVTRGMRRWTMAAACAAGLLVMAFGCSSAAQAQDSGVASSPAAKSRVPTGRLTGEVTDMRGTPLAGTTVSVADLSGKAVTSATTNANGAYTVDGLAEGEYRLNFDAKGFYKKTQKAHVKVGKTGKVHTKLKFISPY
jgi:5-hydroxyisourate hydrolase-like protein (transthyretin family)